MRNYKQEPWSYAEKQILAANYYMVPKAKLLEMLPKRTQNSCGVQALRLRKAGWRFQRPPKP